MKIFRILRTPIDIIYQYHQRFLIEKKFPFLLHYTRRAEEVQSLIKPAYEQYVNKISTPDMAISLKTAIFLYVFCEGLQPKRLLDLGSGFSSFVFRKYAETQKDVTVYSIDDNLEWLKRTKYYLALHNLSTDGLMLWDDFKNTINHHLNFDFDLVFHDLGNMNLRKNSLRLVLELGKNGVIILDDMHKSSYAKYVKACLNNISFSLFSLKAYTLDEYGRYGALVINSGTKDKC